MKRFITHIFDEGLPKQGLRKLSYITTTDERLHEIEYYLGIDNNPLSKSEIDEMVLNNQIIELQKPFVELKENSSLYIANDGNYYFADRNNSNLNIEIVNLNTAQCK